MYGCDFRNMPVLASDDCLPLLTPVRPTLMTRQAEGVHVIVPGAEVHYAIRHCWRVDLKDIPGSIAR